MSRTTPATLHQSLDVAQKYANAGIDFVCVPVLSESDKIDLVNQAAGRFEQVLQRSESKEAAQ